MKINALNLTIENQTVTAEVLSNIVAGTEDVYTVTCFFDAPWDGFAKTLILSNGCEYQFAILDQNGQAEIPRSVIIPGRLYIGVYGVNADMQKMTTRRNKSMTMVYDTDGNIELVPETFQQSQFDELMSELAGVRVIVAEQNTQMTIALQTVTTALNRIAQIETTVRNDANQVASDKQAVANAKTHIDGVKTSVDETLAQVNSKAGEVATNTTKAEQAKTQAQTSAGQASQSATNALASENAAEQAKRDAEQAKDDAVGYAAEVETKRTQALSDIGNAKTETLEAIEEKTQEQLALIPEVTELAEDLTNTKEDLSQLSDTLIAERYIENNPVVNVLGNYTVNSSGKIETSSNFLAYVVDLKNIPEIHLKVLKASASDQLAYSFFSSFPNTSTNSVDGRHLQSVLVENDVSVPQGAKYMVARCTLGFELVCTNPNRDMTVLEWLTIIDNDLKLNGILEKSAIVVSKDSYNINSDGSVSINANYDSYTCDVTGVEKIKITITNASNSDSLVFGFFSEIPTVGSNAINGRFIKPFNFSKEVLIPIGAKYLLLRCTKGFNASIESLDKTLKNTLDDLKMSNVLYGKTLVCCGDSITCGADMEMGDGGFTDNPNIDCYWWTDTSDTDGTFVKKTNNVRMPYGYQIASRNNMTFYNAGVSGSTMQGITGKHGFSLVNGRYTKLPEHIDYLTIWFGWNDTAYGTLGTLSDNTNESYYGGYNIVLPYLIEKYPDTKICLIVPFGCDEGHRNAIRQLANKWGVACWDNYQGGTPLYYGKESSVGVNASIVTKNQQKYQANGAHPNYKGHTQISNMLEHFLRGI